MKSAAGRGPDPKAVPPNWVHTLSSGSPRARALVSLGSQCLAGKLELSPQFWDLWAKENTLLSQKVPLMSLELESEWSVVTSRGRLFGARGAVCAQPPPPAGRPGGSEKPLPGSPSGLGCRPHRVLGCGCLAAAGCHSEEGAFVSVRLQ